MGASSSIVYGEYVSKDDLMIMYGNDYDEELFQQLKNSNNLIKVSDLESIIQQKNNSIKNQKLLEIQRLFKLYCPNGKMTSRNFIQYFKDAKLLKKNKFTINDAEILYNLIKSNQEYLTSTLDCVTFINSLTLIAEKLNIERDLLITKLSKVEYENINNNKNKRIYQQQQQQHEEVEDEKDINNLQQGGKSHSEKTPRLTVGTQSNISNDEKSTAAIIKLQSISRQYNAKKSMKDVREVSFFGLGTWMETFPPLLLCYPFRLHSLSIIYLPFLSSLSLLFL